MNRLHLSIATVFALVLLPAARAQQPAETFAGEVDVVEVLLDVIVTDNDGNVILGLEPDDFVVEEAGQPIQISSATFYSNRLLVDAAASGGRLKAEASDIPTDRYFILFFHDDPGSGTLVLRERQQAVRRAKEWVSESLLPPNDYVAVLRYTKKLLVHQDFTSDVQEILTGLDGIAKGKDPGGNWPSRVDEEDGPSLRRALPQGKELRDATHTIYEALQVVADAAGGVVGRKNLLLFSIGFGEVDSAGFVVPDRRYYPKTYQLLNDNNVAVYGISMLRGPNFSSPLAGSADSALTALASDTGGRHYRTFVNYKTPMAEMIADNNGYYLLSYSSEAPRNENGYREVTIRTRNPDFSVRGRGGYRYGS